MIEPIKLDPFGVLKTKIPTDLQNKLLKECFVAEKQNQEMITGISFKGAPKHYYVTETLQELSNYVFFVKKEYDKYFPGLADLKILTKDLPFVLDKPWFNFQEKNQFIPQHTHDGIYSYNIWLKIPYDYDTESKEQNHSQDQLRCFELTYLSCAGVIKFYNIPLSKEDEGTMIMFPSKLPHIAYPFYSSNEKRISLAGNILLGVN